MLCVFDVNETLLDLAGLDDFFTELTGTPEARKAWFETMIHNALTITASHDYRPFGEIGAACLSLTATRYGRELTPEHRRELGERMRHLPAHPEVHQSITRLRDAGFRVVTLTNSTLEVAEDQLANSGLRSIVDAVYSADTVRRLKPAPEPYHHVLDTERCEPADAVLIAAHDWDIVGAGAAGLRTAFVSRDGRAPLPAAPTTPTIQAPDLAGVVDQLIAAAP